jgi:putative glutamine amidotransferase
LILFSKNVNILIIINIKVFVLITIRNIAIDLNSRIDPFLETLSKRGTASKIKEVISDLLPLLSLNKKTAPIGLLGIFACHITEIDWKRDRTKGLAGLAAAIAYISFCVLVPKKYSVLCSAAYQIGGSLRGTDSRIAKITLIARQAIYVACVYYAAPGLIALSLVCQIVEELHKVTKGFTQSPSSLKDRVNFIVACARLREVYPAYLNHLEKKITQEDWDRIVSEETRANRVLTTSSQENAHVETALEPFPVIDLEEKLNQKGFSSVVEGLTASTSISISSNIIYKDCVFFSSVFTNAVVTNAIFDSCFFVNDGDRVSNLTLGNVSFKKCDLSYQVFVKSVFNNVSFSGCKLSSSVFAFSHFFNTRIISSELEEACFLANKIRDSFIEGCSLTNVFLLEAKNHFNFKECGEHLFTKPIIFFPTERGLRSPRFARMALKVLGKDGEKSLVFPFDRDLITFDPALLRKEVLVGLAKIKKFPPSGMLSFGDELLKRAQPGSQLYLLKEKASLLMEMSSGLYLPGGEDIEDIFYTAPTDVKSILLELRLGLNTSTGLVRTIIELALLQQANKLNIPTIGVCRGSQLINVFFGGTLHNVRGQNALQKLRFTGSAVSKQLKEYLGLQGSFFGVSMHDQAVNILGKGLEVLLKFNNIVKLFFHENGAIIGAQFHPEATEIVEFSRVLSKEEYEDFLKSGKGIFQIFMNKVRETYNRKTSSKMLQGA